MKSTKEKLISRVVKYEKKNKWAGYGLLPFLVVAVICLSVTDYFLSNGKKHVCVIMTLLFFVMSSSFSFPIFEDMELTQQSMAYNVENKMAFLEEKEAGYTTSGEVQVIEASEV